MVWRTSGSWGLGESLAWLPAVQVQSPVLSILELLGKLESTGGRTVLPDDVVNVGEHA